MLGCHPRSDLWLKETSITQTMIKQSQRPLRESSFLWISKEIRGITARPNGTWKIPSFSKKNHIRQSWGKCVDVASLLQHKSTGRPSLRRETALPVSSRRQADSAGRVQVGAGVAAASWGLTSCHCSLKCEFGAPSIEPSLGTCRTNRWCDTRDRGLRGKRKTRIPRRKRDKEVFGRGHDDGCCLLSVSGGATALLYPS